MRAVYWTMNFLRHKFFDMRLMKTQIAPGVILSLRYYSRYVKTNTINHIVGATIVKRLFLPYGTIGFYIYCHRVSELEAELLLVRRHTIAHTNPLAMTRVKMVILV